MLGGLLGLAGIAPAQEPESEGVRLNLSVDLMQAPGRVVGQAEGRQETGVNTRISPETEREPYEQRFTYEVTPNLTYDNNVQRTNAGGEGSLVLSLEPKLGYQKRFGKHTLNLEYLGDYARHRSLRQEDYEDHQVNAGLQLDLTRRLDVNFETGVELGHERRGQPGSRDTDTDVGPVTPPDQFKEGRVYADIIYGREIAKAQISVSLDSRMRRYDNNGQDYRDRDYDTVTGRLLYNLGPKTALVAEVSLGDVDYLEPGVEDLDSSETRYLVGLSWKATAKTTGEFKVGWRRKDLSDETRSDFNGLDWEGRLLWEPRPDSKVSVEAGRSMVEGGAGTSYFVDDHIGAAWRHALTRRWTMDTTSVLRRVQSDEGDTDRYYSLGASISYSLYRWLDVGLGLEHNRRDSSLPDGGYQDTAASALLRFTGDFAKGRAEF